MCWVGKKENERLLRRLAMTRRRQARNDQYCHRERSVAISVVLDWQKGKREIASQARNDKDYWQCPVEGALAAPLISVVEVSKQTKEGLLRASQ